MGYLPENHRFPKYLTGRQTLEFFGAMAKVDRKTVKRRANELLATVGMSGWADKKVATYSKGMLQRVGLAQAMINDPDLIVLDEPTDGVDPVGRRDIRDVLLRMREQGKTVFINSHLLSELEMISDRVAILVQGRVARQGTVEELTRAQQRYEVELVISDSQFPRQQMLGIFRELGAPMEEKQRTPLPPGARRHSRRRRCSRSIAECFRAAPGLNPKARSSASERPIRKRCSRSSTASGRRGCPSAD